MIYSLPHQKYFYPAVVAVLSLLTVSCGSYQQASYYDNDGIYTDDATRVVERRPERAYNGQQESESDTYSDYFGQKANQYDEILENEIFTDVDSYSSNIVNDSINQDQLSDYYNNENDYLGYGGWGDNSSNVVINIHNNGWGGFGYANPWLWNNWGWGYNTWNYWGYGGFYGNGWGWNNPWGWNRWNNWGYAGYYGWGGFYGPGWNYGYGYNRFGYGYTRNFGNRYYARNNSRRGYYNLPSSSNSGIATALRGRSNVNTRGNSPRYRNTTARSSTSRTSTASSRSYSGTNNGYATNRRTVGVDQNRAYRTSRSTRTAPRYNSTPRSGRSYSSTDPRTSGYRSGTSNSGYRSSRSTTPRTSTYRSPSRTSTGRSYSSGSSSNSRSSGYRSSSSSRSSGSSYRSSGRSSSSGSSYRSSGSSSRSSSGGSSRSSSSGRSSSRGGGRQ